MSENSHYWFTTRMGLWRGFGDCDPNIYLATNVDLAAKCAPYSFIDWELSRLLHNTRRGANYVSGAFGSALPTNTSGHHFPHPNVCKTL